jgi:hypothetical protein
MSLPFERKPDESAKAFEAFSTYLELGPARSLESVGRKVGKSKALMERWSKRHNWVARVETYVQHMAALKQKLKEGFLQELALAETERDAAQEESEWKARCRALRLANEAMDRWEANEAKYGTLEGIARLLELSSVLGRRSRGMPMQVKDEAAPVQETRTISIEFVAAIEKIYGQPVPREFIDVSATSQPQEPAKPAQLTEGK